MKEYALYHDDEFVDIGTLRGLAKRQEMKLSTLKWYASPTGLKKQSEPQHSGIFLIRLE